MNLHAKRILITRPRPQAETFARLLEREGARPFFFPVIEILPPEDWSALDEALRNLDRYDWLILKSLNGAEAVLGRLDALGMRQSPAGLRVAAVGPVTAARLARAGLRNSVVPSKYTAAAILPELGDIAGGRILLPGSDIAPRKLSAALRGAGAIVDVVTAYRLVSMQPSPAEFEALRRGVDVVCFASPSSVTGFVRALHAHGVEARRPPSDPLIACIGPVTAAAARAAGLRVDVEAAEHTVVGLLEALKRAEPAELGAY
jgi:uroporphyrinogen III methyltransferase/synthase